MCQVDQCACGTLHITLGALTLRVHPSALASVHQTLGDALAHVVSERAEKLLEEPVLS